MQAHQIGEAQALSLSLSYCSLAFDEVTRASALMFSTFASALTRSLVCARSLARSIQRSMLTTTTTCIKRTVTSEISASDSLIIITKQS